MRIESLYPYIVPLTFLAIWALTSLFNREAQPLPPRTSGRPPGPNGPRPPFGPPANRSFESRGESPTPPATSPRPRPAPRPATTRDDNEILIIGSEQRRAPSSGSRRGGKSRQASASGLQRVESTTPRGLAEPLDRPAGTSTDPAKGLTPLSLPASPLNAPSTLAGTSTEAIGPPTLDRRPISGDEIRALLRSPQRLRESIVLNEILKPPLAARRGPFGKR